VTIEGVDGESESDIVNLTIRVNSRDVAQWSRPPAETGSYAPVSAGEAPQPRAVQGRVVQIGQATGVGVRWQPVPAGGCAGFARPR
jgi:hypothetical protein